MHRLALIYLMAFGLLGYIHLQGPQYVFKAKSYPPLPIFKTMEQKLKTRFKDPQEVGLIMSYVGGGRRHLAASLKTYHQALNLQHLFSPSGLHLAAAYAWVLPWLHGRRRPSSSSSRLGFLLKRIILIFLYALPWSLPGYYAIKRICLLKITYLIISPFKRPDYFWFFLIIMGLDLAAGTFQAAPLSFAYSFLFLGIIIATHHQAPCQQAAALLGGQIIAGFFSLQNVPLAGHFIGQIITVLFSFSFPVLLVGFWGNYFFDWRWIQWPLHWFKELVTASGQLALHLGSFYPSLNILAALAVLLLPRGHWPKWLILTFLLVLHSDPCFNQSRLKAWQEQYALRGSEIQRMQGYPVWPKSPRKCLTPPVCL
ncbi:MAG: hypothetical protein J6Y94_08300 [Bacteriovoracaceae bacterium]|nr:hypothetical protein [Bacteriovoracaceae bacterium]